MIRRLIGLGVLVLALVGPCSTPNPVLQIAVNRCGAALCDYHGNVVVLRGYNMPGMESRCHLDVYPGFISDDPPGTAGRSEAFIDTIVAKAKALGANAIRLPINESCWLGLYGAGGPDHIYAGKAYQQYVQLIVGKAGRAGIYVIIDVHRTRADALATDQDVAPNEAHTVELVRQLADTFKTAHSVILDITQEPHLECSNIVGHGDCSQYNDHDGIKGSDSQRWEFYRDGGAYTYSAADGDKVADRAGTTVQIAGTQQLVNVIRAEGATNLIDVQCLSFATFCSQWYRTRPIDPIDNIAVGQHLYEDSWLNLGPGPAGAYYDSEMGLLATQYPIIIGETGKFVCDAPFADPTGFVAATVANFDARPLDGILFWSNAGTNQGCTSFSTKVAGGAADVNNWGQVVVHYLDSHRP